MGLVCTFCTTTVTAARITHQQSRSLIVGGGPAPRDKYDAVVWSGDIGGWGCGGAMIHTDIFLTAAHCKFAFEEAGGAYVGAYILNATETGDDGGGVFYRAGHILPHPHHKEPHNDIMLVKLKHAFIQEHYEINRERGFPQVGDSVGLVGFGLTEEDGELSPVLKEVTVDVYGFDICYKTFFDESGFKLSDDFQICTGTEEGHRDGCDSDSGTPLLVGNVIVGVTNDGVGCGRPNVPAYNARVSAFADWIDESLCQMSDNPPSHCLKYPFKDEEEQKKICSQYYGQDEKPSATTVSLESFLVSLVFAFVAGAISTCMIMQHSRRRKRSAYQKIMDDDDSVMTAQTEQPSPALSTFSDKFESF